MLFNTHITSLQQSVYVRLFIQRFETIRAVSDTNRHRLWIEVLQIKIVIFQQLQLSDDSIKQYLTKAFGLKIKKKTITKLHYWHYTCTQVTILISVGTIYRIISNIAILAPYCIASYRDNSPPNKTILRTTLVSHVVGRRTNHCQRPAISASITQLV